MIASSRAVAVATPAVSALTNSSAPSSDASANVQLPASSSSSSSMSSSGLGYTDWEGVAEFAALGGFNSDDEIERFVAEAVAADEYEGRKLLIDRRERLKTIRQREESIAREEAALRRKLRRNSMIGDEDDDRERYDALRQLALKRMKEEEDAANDDRLILPKVSLFSSAASSSHYQSLPHARRSLLAAQLALQHRIVNKRKQEKITRGFIQSLGNSIVASNSAAIGESIEKQFNKKKRAIRNVQHSTMRMRERDSLQRIMKVGEKRLNRMKEIESRNDLENDDDDSGNRQDGDKTKILHYNDKEEKVDIALPANIQYDQLIASYYPDTSTHSTQPSSTDPLTLKSLPSSTTHLFRPAIFPLDPPSQAKQVYINYADERERKECEKRKRWPKLKLSKKLLTAMEPKEIRKLMRQNAKRGHIKRMKESNEEGERNELEHARAHGDGDGEEKSEKREAGEEKEEEKGKRDHALISDDSDAILYHQMHTTASALAAELDKAYNNSNLTSAHIDDNQQRDVVIHSPPATQRVDSTITISDSSTDVAVSHKHNDSVTVSMNNNTISPKFKFPTIESARAILLTPSSAPSRFDLPPHLLSSAASHHFLPPIHFSSLPILPLPYIAHSGLPVSQTAQSPNKQRLKVLVKKSMKARLLYKTARNPTASTSIAADQWAEEVDAAFKEMIEQKAAAAIAVKEEQSSSISAETETGRDVDNEVWYGEKDLTVRLRLLQRADEFAANTFHWPSQITHLQQPSTLIRPTPPPLLPAVYSPSRLTSWILTNEQRQAAIDRIMRKQLPTAPIAGHLEDERKLLQVEQHTRTQTGTVIETQADSDGDSDNDRDVVAVESGEEKMKKGDDTISVRDRRVLEEKDVEPFHAVKATLSARPQSRLYSNTSSRSSSAAHPTADSLLTEILRTPTRSRGSPLHHVDENSGLLASRDFDGTTHIDNADGSKSSAQQPEERDRNAAHIAAHTEHPSSSLSKGAAQRDSAIHGDGEADNSSVPGSVLSVTVSMRRPSKERGLRLLSSSSSAKTLQSDGSYATAPHILDVTVDVNTINASKSAPNLQAARDGLVSVTQHSSTATSSTSSRASSPSIGAHPSAYAFLLAPSDAADPLSSPNSRSVSPMPATDAERTGGSFTSASSTSLESAAYKHKGVSSSRHSRKHSSSSLSRGRLDEDDRMSERSDLSEISESDEKKWMKSHIIAALREEETEEEKQRRKQRAERKEKERRDAKGQTTDSNTSLASDSSTTSSATDTAAPSVLKAPAYLDIAIASIEDEEVRRDVMKLEAKIQAEEEKKQKLEKLEGIDDEGDNDQLIHRVDTDDDHDGVRTRMISGLKDLYRFQMHDKEVLQRVMSEQVTQMRENRKKEMRRISQLYAHINSARHGLGQLFASTLTPLPPRPSTTQNSASSKIYSPTHSSGRPNTSDAVNKEVDAMSYSGTMSSNSRSYTPRTSSRAARSAIISGALAFSRATEPYLSNTFVFPAFNNNKKKNNDKSKEAFNQSIQEQLYVSPANQHTHVPIPKVGAPTNSLSAAHSHTSSPDSLTLSNSTAPQDTLASLPLTHNALLLYQSQPAKLVSSTSTSKSTVITANGKGVGSDVDKRRRDSVESISSVDDYVLKELSAWNSAIHDNEMDDHNDEGEMLLENAEDWDVDKEEAAATSKDVTSSSAKPLEGAKLAARRKQMILRAKARERQAAAQMQAQMRSHTRRPSRLASATVKDN